MATTFNGQGNMSQLSMLNALTTMQSNTKINNAMADVVKEQAKVAQQQTKQEVFNGRKQAIEAIMNKPFYDCTDSERAEALELYDAYTS